MLDFAFELLALQHLATHSLLARPSMPACPRAGLVLSRPRFAPRSFAAQDVLVPWHLADHHNQSQNQQKRRSSNDETDTSIGGGGSSNVHSKNSGGRNNNLDNDNAGASATLNDEVPVRQPETGFAGRDKEPSAPAKNIGEGLGQEEGHEDGAAASSEGRAARDNSSGVVAPSPTAPRHGVRVDGLAGSAGSVVYQRYCHVYAEGELERLVQRVNGLRLVESYYDRSNWCVVAEREV